MAAVIVNCLLGNMQKSFELPLISNMNTEDIKTLIRSYLEMEDNNDSFYLTQNGKILQNDTLITDLEIPVLMNFRLLGGKGGFGSMLRAIGAQIEKTTNREACRDLSGRRLRDINEEQRLKKWFAKQKEREEEKEELKRKKLEKLRQFCEGAPLPRTEDPEYNRQRAEMADSIFDAVDKGFETALTTDSSLARAITTNDSSSSGSGEEESPSSSTSSSKEKELPNDIAMPGSSTSASKSSEDLKKEVKKATFKRTFFDEDLDSDDSDDSDTEETSKKKAKVDQA